MLKADRAGDMDWDGYAAAYLEQMASRRAGRQIDPAVFDGAWRWPYLARKWGINATVRHL